MVRGHCPVFILGLTVPFQPLKRPGTYAGAALLDAADAGGTG
jgi:hypothetical protein